MTGKGSIAFRVLRDRGDHGCSSMSVLKEITGIIERTITRDSVKINYWIPREWFKREANRGQWPWDEAGNPINFEARMRDAYDREQQRSMEGFDPAI